MSGERSGRVRQLVDESVVGDLRASDELLPLVYDELRALAAAFMRREGRHQTPSPGDLVHEAYLRLLGSSQVGWTGRGHFFGAAAQAMRRILVERARRYAAARHGGGLERITLSSSAGSVGLRPEEFLDLDSALDRLEERDRRMAEVAKLRYFTGLTVEETADILQIAPRTVDRLWTRARTWLYRELKTRTDG